MSPGVDLNPRQNNPDINAILAQYPRSDDPIKNIDLAKKIIKENYEGAPRSDLVILYLKNHFKLKTDGAAILKMHWSELYKEHKVKLKATGTHIDSRKETSEIETPIESRKESLEAIETPRETRKEAKKREAKEAQEERDRVHDADRKLKEERKAKAEELYRILENEDGTHPEEEIEATKQKIKEILLPDFWSIEGRNQNNPGHVVLQKLAIAEYLFRTYRLIRYAGNNWRYDWKKGFYTYDSDNVLLHHEICVIMNEVGIHDEGNIYNENSIVDTMNIIDMASKREVYIQNPFNKHTGYINARNGVLKLDYETRQITFLGKQPKYLFSYCIDTDYVPEIQNDVIHELLGEILDDEKRELVYQIAAMAIRDADPKLAPSKVAYLLIGRNADKYTVMHLLGKFFGQRIVTRLSLKDIATNKYVKPHLEGKLINLDDNLPENIPLAESRELKSLTGGKFHSLEPKHINPYNGIITALLVFAGDHFPKCSISKNDSAFWDRWEIITFDRKQRQVDEEYIINLLTPDNLSGFFNHVIQKLFEIRENGIIRRNNALTTYDAWQDSSNTVFKFYNEMTEPFDERVEYTREEFFGYYNDWCEAVDIPEQDRCRSMKQYTNELYYSCRVKEYEVKKSGKKRQYVYRMYRKYDSTLFKSQDDGDRDNGDIPDCGYYPRKQ